MSVTFGFYNSVDGDRKYDAILVSKLFDGLIKDGIYMGGVGGIGTSMIVRPNTGLTIVVGEGRAWFNHTWTLNDSELVLEIDPPDVSYARYDAIVLEVDSSEGVRANSIKIVKGDAILVPIKPEMINTETLHQYALAYISVPIGLTDISSMHITNMVGSGSCPFVTGVLTTFNTDALIAQWGDQWAAWYEGKQSDFEAWLVSIAGDWTDWTDEKQSAFDIWWGAFVDELTTEQATNLQLQVNIAGKVIGRKGGSSTSWKNPGTTNYTPTNVVTQCGSHMGGGGIDTVTFPIAFAYAPLVILTANDGKYVSSTLVQSTTTTCSFVIYNQDGSVAAPGASVCWIAIGPPA